MGIFNKHESDKPQKSMGLMGIRDGLDVELRKLRAMETLICFAGEEYCMSLTLPDVKEGISYILVDIGRTIEDGLDCIAPAVEAKVREAIKESKCPDPAIHTEYVKIPFYKDESSDKGDASEPH